MTTGCTITGVHPATGMLVSVEMPERDERDAKKHAEECGLQHVVVTRALRARDAVDEWGCPPTWYRRTAEWDQAALPA